MKTIIAGGRDYHLSFADRVWLDQLDHDISEVVCGGAPGADTGGKEYAELRGKPVKMFPADWQTHGRAAGPIRNQQMADYADALIAFPGGSGTADMIRRAKAKGLKIIVR